MVFFAMMPVPLVWFVRKFKIIKMEADIPVVRLKHASNPVDWLITPIVFVVDLICFIERFPEIPSFKFI